MSILAFTMTCLTLVYIYNKPCLTRLLVGLGMVVMDLVVIGGRLA